jgi:hypothetical protein
VRCFVGKISGPLFLTRATALLLDGSVLRRQASHLLLIRTNLDYGTVLTAAYPHQSCGASGLLFLVVQHTNKKQQVSGAS